MRVFLLPGKSFVYNKDFLCCSVHANKAVQNTVEQNKVGGEVITGRIYYVVRGDFITIEGRLYSLEGRLSHGGDYIT